MAVIHVNINYLERVSGYKKEKIIQGLTDIGAPVEIIDKDKIEVEVTPDRPDLFFMEGIIRALRAYFDEEVNEYRKEKSAYEIIVDKSVKEVRPYIAAAVVKEVELDDVSIENLIEAQEKLHFTIGRKRKKVAIGIHDFDKIKFPLFYKAVENITFVPLDFDFEMTAKEILVKHPKGIEYSNLIDKKFPVILDKEGVLSLPPIINAERTRVNKETNNLFIEVTGTHKESVEGVLNLIVCALADKGGKIYEVKIGKESYPKLEMKEWKIKEKTINNILGIKLKKEEILKHLKRLGWIVKNGKVYPQPYRIDLMHDVDLIEDVAISYGYNNFEPSLPNFFTVGKKNKWEERINDICRRMGFLEVKTYILTNKEREEKVGGKGTRVVESKSKEFDTVRGEMAGSILRVFENNKTKGLPQKIYEYGRVYRNGKEERELVFGLMNKKVNYSELRGILQTFMREINMGFEIKEMGDDPIINSERGGYVISEKGEKIGKIGEVKGEVLRKFGVEFEIGLIILKLRGG